MADPATTGTPSGAGHINGGGHTNGAGYTNGSGYTNGGGHHKEQDFANNQSMYQGGQPSTAAHIPKPHQSTVSQVYDPSFFKAANPGPLGLLSFALTTFVLGFYQCGVGLPGSNPLGSVGPDQAIFGLAIFFGGFAQFVAGVMEFRVGNTFGTTVHCSYGAFWLAFAMFLIPSLDIRGAYANDERAYTVAVGIFLMAWALLTAIFFLAALKTNIAILAVFFFLTLAFFLLAIAEFVAVTHPAGATRVNRAGGAIAIIDGLCAFYAGAAGLMLPDTTWVRLPLGELDYHGPSLRRKNKGPA